MAKAALHYLGCKVNAYETDAMSQLMEDAGYDIVPFNEKADVYIINTWDSSEEIPYPKKAFLKNCSHIVYMNFE